MQFIDLKSQQDRIKVSLDRRISDVLFHGLYIMGPEVVELEQRLANYVGVKHCIGVANGTDALQIALMALGVGSGDEVITPAFSFIAAAEVIQLLGAKPVFVDIDPLTYNTTADDIEAAITDRTKAIIPVDLFGQCANYAAINVVAQRHAIPVIEDGAQSMGATSQGRRSCSLATIATTSFFPSKPLGAYGDGGACFTDDDSLAALMRSIRIHGQDRRYHHSVLGVNGRLDTLQAAIVLAKLEIFEEEVALRQAVAVRYDHLLLNSSRRNDVLVPPHIEPGNTSVYAQYTVRVQNRDAIVSRLTAAGIPTAVHYPLALHQQPVFEAELATGIPCPQSERAAMEVLSIPMHPYLSEEDQISVIDSLVMAAAEMAAA